MMNLFQFIFSINRFKKQSIVLFADLIFNFFSISFCLLIKTNIENKFLLINLYKSLNIFSFLEEFLIVVVSNNLLIFFLSQLFVPIFIFFGIYQTINRYINIDSIFKIIKAIFIYSVFIFLLLLLLNIDFAISFLLIHLALFFLLIFVSRISIYYIYYNYNYNDSFYDQVVVYGAGEAGIKISNLIRYTTSDKTKYKIVAFIDDDKSKENQRINNIQIFHSSEIDILLKKYNISKIILAIPSLNIDQRRKIISNLGNHNIQIIALPSLNSLISSNLLLTDLKEIDLNDLLDRKLNIEHSGIEQIIRNKTILITGAGGSIGSEICAQLILFNPKALILLDNSEFNLYTIHNKLLQLIKDNNLQSEIFPYLTTINNKKVLDLCFLKFSPKIVFHAAAFKHVSLVELNILNSFQNNFIGSLNILELCSKYKIEKLIYISTDKAVNPTSVMGATKKLSEKLLVSYKNTKFKNNNPLLDISIVRFGNVLASSGSIIPLFKEQIKSGGPITITHPDVTRYFMTIPEAVGLVLQSSKLKKDEGNIFILNMGKPIKILDLAKKMINFYGLRELDYSNKKNDNTIKIEFIGLRQGEKMHEELMQIKSAKISENQNIYIDNESILKKEELENLISESIDAAQTCNLKKINNILINYGNFNNNI